MELFSPQIAVGIGAYTFEKGVELEISSCRDTPFDWAKIRFVSPFEHKITLARREPATIWIGYNGEFSKVFVGYSTCDFTSGDTGNEVILKDGMLLLEDARINNTFLKATPQEIIRYIAKQAGATKLLLDETPYRAIPCLPILSQNGIRAIRSLDDYWRIHSRLYFEADCLCWGRDGEQSELYHFEYAKNIISLRLADGCWELQTVSVPFVRHSQMIRVTHPSISGDFRVDRLRVATWGRGFIRTWLYFKEV